MLKNSDLRVGNYIQEGNNGKYYNDGTFGKVLEIGNDEREFEQIYCECEESFDWFFKDNYFGIELTEDWLIKFEFEKVNSLLTTTYQKSISWSKSDYKVISINIDNGNQYVYIRHGGLNADRTKDDLICIFNGDVNGKLYVHYIQNLYFLITGKDLIIK